MIIVEEPNVNYCRQIADNLREEDLGEIRKLHPFVRPISILLASISLSERTYTFINTEPVDHAICLIGVGTDKVNDGYGVVWMLSTPEAFENNFRFIKANFHMLPTLCEGYKVLHNFVSKDNHKAIEWLEFLGFDFFTPEEGGIEPPEGFLYFCSSTARLLRRLGNV